VYHIGIYAQNGRVGSESPRGFAGDSQQVYLPNRYDAAGSYANQDYVLDEEHSEEDQCQNY
jgi:hypothetical protein